MGTVTRRITGRITGASVAATWRRTVAVSVVLGLLLAGVALWTHEAAAHPGHQDPPPDSIGFTVNSPDALAGFVPAIQWTNTAPITDEQADLVYAGTGCTPAHYAPVDVEGKIAIIDDQFGTLFPGDTCLTYTFFQKVQAAQEAGAIGLIQVERDDEPFQGDAADGDIPALAVTQTDGEPIRDAVIDGEEPVNVTLVDTRRPDEPIELDEPLSDIPCVDGRAGPFECDGVDLLAFVPLAEFEGARDARQALGGGLSDVWGWEDPENGDEYVILGKTNGVAFFRVTDPTDPVYLGELPNRAVLQLIWHDIKVFEDHAFIVSESNPHGMKVFDLARLRDVDEPQVWDEDGFYPLPAAAHNVELNVDTGFAYIVGGNAALAVPDQCLSGLHMVDVNIPTLPVFAGCYLEEGGPGTVPRVVGGPVEEASPLAYVHDAQCVIYDGPDQRYVGNEICFNSAERKVVIADVTDKLNPVTLGVTEYPMVGYTHQGWLTEDHRFLIVNDEGDELDFGINTRTVVLDVTDLENPDFHFAHDHGTRSITHNNYVHEGLVYMSNYTSGLRVLDVAHIGDPDDPRLEPVGFFDTFPHHGDTTFEGTWSNYPFFASGTIAVTGIDEGLFLLRLADEEPPLEVEVNCDNCPVEIRAGESGTAALGVTGHGTFDLSIHDLPEGWSATADADQVSVEQGATDVVEVSIEVPRQQRAGSHSFTVTATATDDADVSASATVDVDVVKGPPAQAGPPDGGPPGQQGQAPSGSGGDGPTATAGSRSGVPPALPAAIVVLGLAMLVTATAGRRLGN